MGTVHEAEHVVRDKTTGNVGQVEEKERREHSQGGKEFEGLKDEKGKLVSGASVADARKN